MKMLRKGILFILAAGIVLALGINFYIVKSTESRIVLEIKAPIVGELPKTTGWEEIKSFSADCILVLGAGVKEDGTPNYMLEDRLSAALALYRAGAAPKLLLSGDHGRKQYDEVNAMKKYMIDAGVPEEDLFLDHAGFSTYETMYRAGAVFEVQKAIVVTQEYHQYRALYIGKELGLQVIGVASDQARYRGQTLRDLREIAARDKDFLKTILRPTPTYLGEVIPISGSGLASHDDAGE